MNFQGPQTLKEFITTIYRIRVMPEFVDMVFSLFEISGGLTGQHHLVCHVKV